MNPSRYQIAYLADHPEFQETVARWNWEEWTRDVEGWTFEQALDAVVRLDSHKDKLNLTLIALDKENQIVGSLQLIEDERCPGWRNVGPWMGGLYILPEHRNKGIAYQLSYTMIQKATEMGFDEIYCFTMDFDHILKRHHFDCVDTVDYGGENYQVFRKSLY